MQETRFEKMAKIFGSLSDARGHALEIVYFLDHLDDGEYTETQISRAKKKLVEIKKYLAEGDEAL